MPTGLLQYLFKATTSQETVFDHWSAGKNNLYLLFCNVINVLFLAQDAFLVGTLKFLKYFCPQDPLPQVLCKMATLVLCQTFLRYKFEMTRATEEPQ